MRPRVVMAMQPVELCEDLFGHEMNRLAQVAEIEPRILQEFDSLESREVLAQADILLAGWGCPPLDESLLNELPRLRAVLFAGGSAAAVIDPELARRRGIYCADAGEANAKAVAEYSLAMILLSNKRFRFAENLYREQRSHVDREVEFRRTGNFGTTVGLVGASRIGRRVAALLMHTDLNVMVFDPYVSESDVASLGATKCELDELLTRSHVVSIHAPATAETHHIIGARELALMRDSAVLINTARGSLVDHDALLPHLRDGRLDAVLDVTTPEPLPRTHELWTLPNVTLTPHIAGATGNELKRMGTALIDKVEQIVRSESVGHSVDFLVTLHPESTVGKLPA